MAGSTEAVKKRVTLRLIRMGSTNHTLILSVNRKVARDRLIHKHESEPHEIHV
jgi:hypothetical protein